jgi:hypothetical protein
VCPGKAKERQREGKAKQGQASEDTLDETNQNTLERNATLWKKARRARQFPTYSQRGNEKK